MEKICQQREQPCDNYEKSSDSATAGLSIRKISAGTKISVGSIQHILKLAVQLNITWPLPEDWDDQTLALKFYPRADARPSTKFQEPIWTDAHQELEKKGVTKQLLWDDCRDAAGRAKQEQLPRNMPSNTPTDATATRSLAPAMPTG